MKLDLEGKTISIKRKHYDSQGLYIPTGFTTDSTELRTIAIQKLNLYFPLCRHSLHPHPPTPHPPSIHGCDWDLMLSLKLIQVVRKL